MVTLDTWTLAWRPQDLDRSYLPFLRGVGTAIPFSDPAFRAGLARPPEEDLQAAVLRWVPMFTGTDKSWDRLPFLREHWSGPIVLKGVLHPDDARRAADSGMDGVIVSNHGGRQVDGAIAALDALPPVVDAVRAGSRCCSTRASGPGPTWSRHLPWVHRRYWLVVQLRTVSPTAARWGCATSCVACWRTST